MALLKRASLHAVNLVAACIDNSSLAIHKDLIDISFKYLKLLALSTFFPSASASLVNSFDGQTSSAAVVVHILAPVLGVAAFTC